jgi:hypothetical protein
MVKEGRLEAFCAVGVEDGEEEGHVQLCFDGNKWEAQLGLVPCIFLCSVT